MILLSSWFDSKITILVLKINLYLDNQDMFVIFFSKSNSNYSLKIISVIFLSCMSALGIHLKKFILAPQCYNMMVIKVKSYDSLHFLFYQHRKIRLIILIPFLDMDVKICLVFLNSLWAIFLFSVKSFHDPTLPRQEMHSVIKMGGKVQKNPKN